MTTAHELRETIVPAVLGWYQLNRRDLPWRRPQVSAWEVLVSEIMLQQTPVARVLPVYDRWINRWPVPAALAVEPPSAPIRAWGRLGYPRRALRLHEAARMIVARHGGKVPSAYEDLLGLPGVGTYTAAAVASFAYRQRQVVLDTNVRRVLARAVSGVGLPSSASPTAAERRTAEAALPSDNELAAQWSVAAMELGALVCTTRSPRCTTCPIATSCAWRRLGSPPAAPQRVQSYAGTDRQARGRLLAVLREAHEPVSGRILRAAWRDDAQAARALDALVADGLVEPLAHDRYRLPSGTSHDHQTLASLPPEGG